MHLKPLIIYPKDIRRITGRTERWGRDLIKKIRDHYQKGEHQFVTVEEFCGYTGLEYEQVVKML